MFFTSFSKTLSYIILFFLCNSIHIFSQQNIGLEQKVEQYLNALSPEKQYDALSDLMEFNSTVNLEEVSYYYDLFNTDEYRRINPKYPIISHYVMADVLYYYEDKDSSLYHYLSLSNLANEQKEFMLAASGLGNSAYILSELGDKVGALNLLKQNADIAYKSGDARDISDYTYNIASLYADLEFRDSAVHYFEKTIDIDRKAHNDAGMVYNIHTLLGQYLASNEEVKSETLCHECIEIAERIVDAKAESMCYYYLARVNLQGKNFNRANEAISNAIRIDDKRKDVTRKSKFHKVLADILSSQDKLEEASHYYQSSISAAKNGQQISDLVEANIAYSSFLFKKNEQDNALSILSKVEQMISENKLQTFSNEVFKLFENIYSSLGNFKKVSEYQALQIAFLNKELGNENLLATEQSKNAFDLFKQENINRTLNAEKKLADAKVKRRNAQIVFSAVLILLLFILAYFYFQNQKQKNQIKSSQLQLQIIEKELFALRSQMNPHFLFNSLNSINDYIMHEEPREASRYLSKFSNLMRTILNNSKENLISLKDELVANNLYIEMENMRFKDKFEYLVNIDPSIDAENAQVPAMLIQPFLENAIKHGLRNSSKAGIITLDVKKDDANLVIEITDNGIGRKEAARLNSKSIKGHKSVGTGITKNRINLLNQIHNVDAHLQIIDLENPTGTKILIRIKYLSSNHSEL